MILLQNGDILLWRIGPESSYLHRLIGWGERLLKQSGSKSVNYYHVAFVGPGVYKYYQSKFPCISNADVPKELPSYMEVCRLKKALTDDQLTKIFIYANSQLGKWYNLLGVLSGGFVQVGTFSYCSQFAWQAYTHAGIVLCPWENLESPDDIACSDLLYRVE